MYKLLRGADAHPYLTDEELDGLRMFESNKIMYCKAAALIIDAPCVLWPEGKREAYPLELVQLVENLLIRHRDRAGSLEVSVSARPCLLLAKCHDGVCGCSVFWQKQGGEDLARDWWTCM